MSSDVRIDHRVRAKPGKGMFHGLWAAPIAWLMASTVATAQENPNPGGSSSTTALPEIRVIATTPVAPPRVAPRPPAAAAAPTPAATPTVAAETAPKAVPGAVELDKIPSNVVTSERPLLTARRRRIFCSHWTEHCLACHSAARLETTFSSI